MLCVQEIGCTVIFVAYLAYLRWYNIKRSETQQEATFTAADFTLEVRGLSTLYTDATAFSNLHVNQKLTLVPDGTPHSIA
jgi:hypothetical protein